MRKGSETCVSKIGIKMCSENRIWPRDQTTEKEKKLGKLTPTRGEKKGYQRCSSLYSKRGSFYGTKRKGGQAGERNRTSEPTQRKKPKGKRVLLDRRGGEKERTIS